MNSKFRNNIFYYILSMIFILQFLTICYFNLFQLQNHIGYDTSTYFYSSIMMWKQKSLFLHNWDYQTTLVMDSVVPLAALFYGITGNIFISYGIANILCTIGIVYCFHDLLRYTTSYKESRILVLNLLLVLHFWNFYSNFNSLMYGDVLLVNNSAYSVKTLLSLLIIGSVIKIYNKKNSKLSIFIILFLNLITGISSGYWILVTVLCPLLLWRLNYFLRKKLNREIFLDKIIWFITSNIIILIIGKWIAKNIIGYSSKDSFMTLIGLDRMWDNLVSILLGLLDLTTSMPESSGIPVISFHGISCLTNFVFTSLIILSIVFILYKKKYLYNELYQIALFIIFTDIFIFSLLDTTYGSPFFETRYLITPYLLMLVLFSSCVDELFLSRYPQVLIWTGSVIGLIIINIASNLPYYKQVNNYSELCELKANISKYPEPIVYVFGDSLNIDARNLRVIDTNKFYKAIRSDMTAHHWGDSTCFDDVSEYDNSVLIITNEAELAYMPAYLKESITALDDCGSYKIFRQEKNQFDFVTGFNNERDYNIDFPHSPGMLINDDGDITDDNILENKQSEGKYVMYGPYVEGREGKYNITLDYEFSGNDNEAIFDVSAKNGTEILQKQNLISEKNKAVLHNVTITDGTDLVEYRVYLSPDTSIKINFIQIERVN